jgi:Fe-S cluster assembly scaffold protein SufB
VRISESFLNEMKTQGELDPAFTHLVFCNGVFNQELSSETGVMNTGDLVLTSSGKPYKIHLLNEKKTQLILAIQVPAREKVQALISSVTAKDVDFKLYAPLEVGANANLSLAWLQNSNESTKGLVSSAETNSSIELKMKASASVKILTAPLSGQSGTSEVIAHMEARDASLELNGIMVGQKEQRLSTKTKIDHKVPQCYSRQNFKAMLSGASRSQFIGEVHIHRGAVGTDSGQSHKALLLSREAFAEAEPRLRIDADDVKAAHGATVGRLQKEEIFYLQSRGFDKKMAEAILCEAFVQDLVDQLENESIRKELTRKVSAAVNEALKENYV